MSTHIQAALISLLMTLLVMGWMAFILAKRLPPLPVATPQGQWEHRDFNTYQVEIKSNGCDVIYDVTDEKVGQVYAVTPFMSSCYLEAYSVSQLFLKIGQIDRCGPNGCGCDGPVEVHVSYHSHLGYPMRITSTVHPDQRVRYPSYWLKKLPIPSICTQAGFGPVDIEIMSLTPQTSEVR